MNLPVEELWKSVKIWWNYRRKFGVSLFRDTVYGQSQLFNQLNVLQIHREMTTEYVINLWLSVAL